MGVSAYNRSPQKRQHGGFSLLEVLIAFVIMGLTVTAILQLVGNSLRSVALADEYSYAIQIAESKMATVGHMIPISVGSHTGTVQNKFNWMIKISKRNVLNAEVEQTLSTYPYHILVEINWPLDLDAPQHSFQLSSLRFGKAVQ